MGHALWRTHRMLSIFHRAGIFHPYRIKHNWFIEWSPKVLAGTFIHKHQLTGTAPVNTRVSAIACGVFTAWRDSWCPGGSTSHWPWNEWQWHKTSKNLHAGHTYRIEGTLSGRIPNRALKWKPARTHQIRVHNGTYSAISSIGWSSCTVPLKHQKILWRKSWPQCFTEYPFVRHCMLGYWIDHPTTGGWKQSGWKISVPPDYCRDIGNLLRVDADRHTWLNEELTLKASKQSA